MDYESLGFPRTEYDDPVYPIGTVFEYTVRFSNFANYGTGGYKATKIKPARYQPCQENPKCQTP